MNDETKWELMNEIRDLENFYPHDVAIQKTSIQYGFTEDWLEAEYQLAFPD